MNQFSQHTSFHSPKVTEVKRHDDGVLAVSLGEWPSFATLFFKGDELKDFVNSIREFLKVESDRIELLVKAGEEALAAVIESVP